jgi:hypothetical protein
MVNSNFIVKVTDAKLTDVQKALQAGGVKVRSIIEVFREETKPTEPEEEKRYQTNGGQKNK